MAHHAFPTRQLMVTLWGVPLELPQQWTVKAHKYGKLHSALSLHSIVGPTHAQLCARIGPYCVLKPFSFLYQLSLTYTFPPFVHAYVNEKIKF